MISRGIALPVVEFGRRDSDFVVVHVHGGPGESRLDTALGAETRLAASTLYVTWAQRTTPFATGPLQRDSATLAQHVEDLSAVLATVHARHPNKRVFLTGFSWGGAMVLEYLANAPAPFVEGAAVIGALVDARRAIDDSWTMLRAHGRGRIEAGLDASYWRAVVDKSFRYATAIDALPPQRYLRDFVRPRITACNRMRDDLGLPDNVENSSKGVYERFHLLPPTESVAVEWMVEEILTIDVRPRLPDVSHPMLVLWGREDCNSPRAAAEIIFDTITTPAASKTLRILPGIPHDVLDAAPVEYATAVAEFIDGLR